MILSIFEGLRKVKQTGIRISSSLYLNYTIQLSLWAH